MKWWKMGVVLALLPLWLAAQTPPPGWTRQPAGADAAQVFKPSDLAVGEDTAVSYYPRASLSALPLDKWLEQALNNDAPPAGGAWTEASRVKPATANVASATRAYRDLTGKQGFALYLAVSVDRQVARLARWSANSEQVGRRHQSAAQALMQQLSSIEKDSARTKPQDSAIQQAPPAANGERSGAAAETAPSTATTASDAQSKKASPTPEPAQAPAAGPGPAIHAVAMVGQWETGGLRYRPVVLYADHFASRITDLPPERVAASARQAGSRDWGQWRVEGEELRVQWDDGSQMQSKLWTRCRPADARFTLDGVYATFSGTADMTMMLARDYRFTSTGRYTQNSVLGGAAGTPGTGAKEVVIDAQRHVEGRYRLQGYGIALEPDGGPAIARLFCRFSDSDSAVFIGDTAFSKD
jgi:hypothetical protein